MTSTRQWLLLAFTLPARPSNARVKAWRRLQQLGAVLTRNAVYVLPNSEQSREDFEWIRREIVDGGGEATIFAADVVDAKEEEDIVARIRHIADTEYRDVKRQADRLAAAARRSRSSQSTRGSRLTTAARALRLRFDTLTDRDAFGAIGRQAAADSLNALDALSRPKTSTARAHRPRLSIDAYQRRRWVTRPRPGVDRMSSAWLIRRFIDPRATFTFADRRRDAEVSFDMFGGDFSHENDRCTFEVLAERFAITDPVVTRIGRIVHDLDMRETRYAPPEAPAIAHMVEGLRRMHPDDAVLLEQGIGMFESLAQSFAASEPARRPRKRAEKPTTRRPRGRPRPA
jgi:hypothetical protein